MALANYSDLSAAITSWSGRSDLTSTQIDQYVALCEAQLNRELACEQMIAAEALITTDGNGRYALPADYLQMSMFRTNANPSRPVSEVSRETGIVMRSGAQTYGYSINGGYIYTWPAAAAATFYMSYYANIPGLTVSNTTNWLMTAHPDVYLYGTLLQATAFVRDDRVPLWKEAYLAAIQSIRGAETRRQWAAHSLASYVPNAI